jgi:hypothetical protein
MEVPNKDDLLSYSSVVATKSCTSPQYKEKNAFRRTNTTPAVLDMPVHSTSQDYGDQKSQFLPRKIPAGAQIKAVIFSSRITFLLSPCIPIGFTVYNISGHTILVALVNFAAIFPSAIAISIAMNDLNIQLRNRANTLLNRNIE